MSATSTSEAEAELIPSLPNDMALNVLVRVPRAHHPILSLVSKSIRSLLSSPSFFTTRALLNTPEHFLYLTLRNPHPSSPHLWFTLHNNRRLVPVPPSPSLYIGSAYVALGPKVYVIGGSRNDVLYPHVWVLDCRFNKWEQAPNMRVPREFAAAGAVDGKIYIMGGCIVDTWARCRNWAEVFDPVIGQWETVASEIEVREKWMHACAVVDDKIYAMADRGGVVYDPRERQWGTVGKRLDLGWRGRACGIDGVLYCYDYLGKIRGFDLEQGVWKELKGVEKGLPKFLCGATMADLGGKLMVVWEGRKGNSSSGCNRKDMEIWCACLEVKKEGKELFGKIDWCNSVLKVPTGSSIVHCLAVAL